MERRSELAALKRRRVPVMLAAGFFDGVHRGHARVIRQAVERARACGGEAWVLTFDPHPLKVLNPAAAPKLLTCNTHKLRLFERLGLHGCVVLPFTRALAAQAPKDFVARLRDCVPPLAEVLVGSNWRFGHNGGGHSALLARMTRDLPLRVTTLRPSTWKGVTISSTRIRHAVANGRLVEAETMLGRPFSVLGTVVRGRGVGRTLGFPTANLDSNNEVLPPLGVYAVQAWIGRRLYDGLLNLGVHPTFGVAPAPTIELHLLNVSMDLYGRDVEVFFTRRIRDEAVFASVDQLRARIAEDIRQTERLPRRAAKRKKLEEYLYRNKADVL